MNYDDVVLGRRSIRGYQDKAVPQKLIEEILTLAMRSPSSMNTQPWNFTVVSGGAGQNPRRQYRAQFGRCAAFA